MTERKQDRDQGSRNELLRAALRENLRRRKAQARGRAASAERADKVSVRKKNDEGSTR